MSLQLAAQHIAHKGRGPDTTLVHMSRDEVKSLNNLAMAHGGQLTINPETGLPEAGFLSSILPMVAGAALTGLSGGTLSPLTASLMVGAGSYALNPSKGLMGALTAGMGAYGGATMGGGLEKLGATSEAGLTSTGSSMDYAAQNAEAIKNANLAEQAKLANATRYTSPDFLDVGGTGSNYLPTGSGGLNVTGNNIGADFEQMPGNMPQNNLVSNPLTGSQLPPQAGIEDRLSNMKAGLGKIIDTPSNVKALGGGSYAGLAQAGLMAATPALSQQTKYTPPTPVSQKSIAPRYKFSPGMATPTPVASASGVENTYFRPQYTAISDEEAKNIYGFAGGGPVEAMSNANAIGANTGFPQAYLHNPAYATPYQTPMSQNVLTGAGDTSVDPYTGEQRMASGGMSYDPQTQRYTGGISDAYSPANRDVNIYNDTSGPGTAGGPSGGPNSSTGSTSSGSPTGSTIGDLGYAISNQSISPIAAMVAGAMMDALSSTSVNSVNAVNGMDAASDAATAGGASSGAGADGPAGAGSTGMGSDVGGEGGASSSGSGGDGGGEARGGLAPYFKHHMAAGGKANAYRTTLDDSLATAYAKAQEKNDTTTMRAIEDEMEIREANNAGMTQGLSGMKGLAGGGISGTGSLDLNIPLDFGGAGNGGGGAFGGANANGYQAVGSGFQDQLAPTIENQQATVDPNSITGFAYGGMATGGISDAHYNLGGYSDGGRLLRGPGDGVSDSIPAVIGKKQPARLADGEFVVPARIVSELGNGSTEAGARRLYAMMDRIQAARGKTVGKGKVAKNTRADKYLPA